MARFSRRSFLLLTVASVATSSNRANPVWAELTLAQRGWRYCGSCGVLFHRESGRGVCPNNPEGHAAAGFEFTIRFTDGGCSSDTETTQSRWRMCGDCLAMFFNGEDVTKICPAGGRHSRDPDRCFDVPTNRLNAPALNPENAFNQGGWRFCGRCAGMFFDGYLDNKGVCPAGGSHAALGDLFVLTHF